MIWSFVCNSLDSLEASQNYLDILIIMNYKQSILEVVNIKNDIYLFQKMFS